MTTKLRAVVSACNAIQRDAISFKLAPQKKESITNWEKIFEVMVTDYDLGRATKKLFIDGHYPQAVEQAYKYINNLVKKTTRIRADGAALMRTAFSVNSPLISINALQTDSDRNQQQGYMDIFAGCMTGIRNPRAHEHELIDEPEIALELLAWANHLTRMIKRSTSQNNVSTPPSGDTPDYPASP